MNILNGNLANEFGRKKLDGALRDVFSIEIDLNITNEEILYSKDLHVFVLEPGDIMTKRVIV